MKSIFILTICLAFFGVISSSEAAIDVNAAQGGMSGHSGSFGYSIPIHTPRGSGGFQPSLALSYNSSGSNGLYGMGWSLSLAKIQRSTLNGKPKYDDTDDFELFIGGSNLKLIDAGAGEYRTRDEGMFLKISKVGNTWTVKDKTGTVYHFGLNDLAQNSAWPLGAAAAYRWHVSKVVDAHGNTVSFHYVDDIDGHRVDHKNYEPTNKVTFI